LLRNNTPTFCDYYRSLLATLLTQDGIEEKNERTGRTIRALEGGASFKLDLSLGKLPLCGVRRTFPTTAAAEVAWFLQGKRDITWLRKHCRIWDKFTEDDGNTIAAAYGWRWREAFGRDQIELAIEALATNPSDRRVYVSAWDPSTDGLGAANQKNVPCPVGFTLSIVGGRLHSTMLIRSSDVFVGLPYDVMGHAMLMGIVSESLQRPLGTAMFTLAHPHLYDSHFEAAEQALSAPVFEDEPQIIGWSVGDVTDNPDGFVDAYRRSVQALVLPQWDPKPDVVA
jgi:thymidylate synthase